MEAPTPVSTYLHSATMVQAGIYLLARLALILGGTPAWEYTLIAVGTITMLTGAWMALVHTDLKRILAFPTISALGMFVLLIGIGTETALQAVVTYLTAHALYKATLFMSAGILDHATGTRDAESLGGLGRILPFTAVTALLAAASTAGLPPFSGFIGKELVFETTLTYPMSNLLTVSMLFAGISFVVVAAIVGIRPFLGAQKPKDREYHRAAPGLWIGPVLLGIGGLWTGLQSNPFGKWLLTPAVAAILQDSAELEYGLWHGWNLKVALSSMAVVAGVLFYFGWVPFRRTVSRLGIIAQWGPEKAYHLLLRGLTGTARIHTRILQNGYLNYYLLFILLTVTGLLWMALLRTPLEIDPPAWTNAFLYEGLLAVIMLIAIVQVVITRSRMLAVICLGVVGFGMALQFFLFSAPDLAMTQFSVETLFVVLLVLVILRLPTYKNISTARKHIRDAIPAVMTGGLITTILLITMTRSEPEKISDYFIEHSLSLAHSRNIVNVILIDFRGLDTLGEITVLALSALGVYSLIRVHSKTGSAKEIRTEKDIR